MRFGPREQEGGTNPGARTICPDDARPVSNLQGDLTTPAVNF
jgi:hypothetical protein